MKKSNEAVVGWVVVIAIVVGVVYFNSPKKPSGPTIEVKVLSANVNGRLYTKEASPHDFASQKVVMPAADNSEETVILPWSDIKVSTESMSVSELVDSMEFYNKFVEGLRAKNDPILPEVVQEQQVWQSQLFNELTPEQANAVNQEILRRQQSHTPP